jgi:RNA-directed DNA polymerase
MGVKHPEAEGYQPELFPDREEPSRHGASGEGGTGPGACEVAQTPAASDSGRALTDRLMEEVCRPENVNRAWKRVKANKGAPGVDGLRVTALPEWLEAHRGRLLRSLLDGSYEPQPVRGVQIPKPGGGMRQLGIPTVVDRLVQQAISQVLEPILDPMFSVSSFGFRPGRSAHQALQQASAFVKEGRTIVVDIDLEKYFDRVNHDILMARLARHVEDRRLLRIVRRFLQAGMMQNGVCVQREEGTPQGGPLSPLLANLLLDDLDKELERRGHCFCRYADDCNIYVASQAAGERVLTSVTGFLQKKLKLQVNPKKSAVARTSERQFLGYRILAGGRLGIAPASLKRMKDRVRKITRRNRSVRFARVIEDLNTFLPGWVSYFQHAQAKTALKRADEWIRRKVRCFRLKQWKRPRTIFQRLHKGGVYRTEAAKLASSGKGWWRKADTPAAHQVLTNRWLADVGLVNLSQHYLLLQH